MNKKITSCLSLALALILLFAHVPLRAQSGGHVILNGSKQQISHNRLGSEIDNKSIGFDKFGSYRQVKSKLYRPNPITPKNVSNDSKKLLQPIMKVKGGPKLWGVVEYSSAWENLPEEERPTGVYSFLATSPNVSNPLLVTGVNGPNAGGVFYDGKFHYVNYYIMYETTIVTYTYCYNINTWEQDGYAQYGSDGNIIGTDLTYDETTGNVYGYFYNPLNNTEPMRFGIITYTDYGAEVTTICQENDDMICIASDKNGQLYAITSDGGFWKVDKTSGAKTLIDYTGVRPSTFRQSATFDDNTGKLYWTAFLEDYTSALYEIDPSNGRATLISKMPDNMEVSCLYIPEPEASDEAPAAVTDFATSFSGSSTNGSVSFTMPSETYGGSALSGMNNYKIFANDSIVKEGKAEAGSFVTEKIDVNSGQNEIYVIISNDAGNSPASNKVNSWIGYDVPVAPTDVVLNIDENRKASLSWKAPDSTLHNGYFDVSSIKYNVIRYPGSVEVANNISDTEFSEVLPEGKMTSYHYDVLAVNGDMVSEPASSNNQSIGSAFDVPYYDDFSDESTYGIYTVINSNNDDKTWLESNNCFSYFFSWSNNADDWLLTPPIKLKAGESYVLSFDIKGSSTYDTERYEVSYGTGKDPVSYTNLVPATELKTSNYTTVKKTFTVDADGDYYFGFHAISDSYMGILSVTNIGVDLATKTSTPDSVENLTVVPYGKGELKTKISFKTPVNSIDGKALNGLSKVDVYRNNNVLVSSIENPEMGADYSCIDENASTGYNKYVVYAYNEDGRGKASVDSAYVGIDIPNAPTNVKVLDNGHGVTITWNVPDSVGVNGGYVDKASLTYNIYNQNGVLVREGITSDKVDLDADLESETGILYYGITAVSASGESGLCTSNYLVTGKPAVLPFSESFANGGTNKSLWWSYGNNPINAFSFSVDNSYDHDMGSASWYAINEGDYAYLNSGKITAEGSENPMLFFSYYATPGDSTMLKVIAECADGSEVNVGDFNIKDLDGDKEWRKAALALGDSVKRSKYFVLKFYVESKTRLSYIYIDDIVVRDVNKNDLKNASIVSAPSVKSGDSIEVKTTVSNYGSENAGKFKVNLYADDQKVSETELDGLAFNTDTVVVMNYKALPNSNAKINLSTSIEYSEDQDYSNNTSGTVELNVIPASYPTVSDLSGISDNGGVTLDWSEPVISDNNVEESFESITPWSINGGNGWTVFDGDKDITNSYTAMWYPHIGEKLSFILFNKNYAIMDSSQEPIFTAHSGDQCMAAFATLHDYSKDIPTDDWLISPELSGEKQNISFWIKSYTDYQEDFYVYYSTDDADTLGLRKNLIAFEKWGAGSTWKQYEYEVPAGAKYFGIRYTSNLSGILVDDFVYTGKPLAIEGYNIYRDNVLIGSVKNGITKFIDNDATSNEHTYAVTVVYNVGESEYSNMVSLTTSSINGVTVSKQNLNVYTLDGVKIFTNDIKSLKRGVYIINGKKVIVK